MANNGIEMKLFFNMQVQNILNNFKTSDKDTALVEYKEFKFRFLKVFKDRINFEVQKRDQIGTYFSPICIISNFLNTETPNLFVLNEFYSNAKEELLKSVYYQYEAGLKNLVGEFIIKRLSFEVDVIVAGYSRVVYLTAIEMFEKTIHLLNDNSMSSELRMSNFIKEDRSLRVNGIDLDLIFDFNGNINLFVDDRYNFSGGFVVFYRNGSRADVAVNISYDDLFPDLNSQELLTVLKER